MRFIDLERRELAAMKARKDARMDGWFAPDSEQLIRRCGYEIREDAGRRRCGGIDHLRRIVHIRPGLSPGARRATLRHEAGHLALHREGIDEVDQEPYCDDTGLLIETPCQSIYQTLQQAGRFCPPLLFECWPELPRTALLVRATLASDIGLIVRGRSHRIVEACPTQRPLNLELPPRLERALVAQAREGRPTQLAFGVEAWAYVESGHRRVAIVIDPDRCLLVDAGHSPILQPPDLQSFAS